MDRYFRDGELRVNTGFLIDGVIAPPRRAPKPAPPKAAPPSTAPKPTPPAQAPPKSAPPKKAPPEKVPSKGSRPEQLPPQGSPPKRDLPLLPEDRAMLERARRSASGGGPGKLPWPRKRPVKTPLGAREAVAGGGEAAPKQARPAISPELLKRLPPEDRAALTGGGADKPAAAGRRAARRKPEQKAPPAPSVPEPPSVEQAEKMRETARLIGGYAGETMREEADAIEYQARLDDAQSGGDEAEWEAWATEYLQDQLADTEVGAQLVQQLADSGLEIHWISSEEYEREHNAGAGGHYSAQEIVMREEYLQDPIGALTIIAHEMSHALDDHTGNLDRNIWDGLSAQGAWVGGLVAGIFGQGSPGERSQESFGRRLNHSRAMSEARAYRLTAELAIELGHPIPHASLVLGDDGALLSLEEIRDRVYENALYRENYGLPDLDD